MPIWYAHNTENVLHLTIAVVKQGGVVWIARVLVVLDFHLLMWMCARDTENAHMPTSVNVNQNTQATIANLQPVLECSDRIHTFVPDMERALNLMLVHAGIPRVILDSIVSNPDVLV